MRDICAEQGLEHQNLLFFKGKYESEIIFYSFILYCSFIILTDVRWLSLGQSSVRMYELHTGVNQLLLEKSNTERGKRLQKMASEPLFWPIIAYLGDIFTFLNKFCIKLQGDDRDVFLVIVVFDLFLYSS